MNFTSFEFPKLVTGRRVFKERHTLPPVKRIDCGGKARGLAGESRQDDMAAGMRHHVGERRARVAGRSAAFEHRIVARGNETVDPASKGRCGIEERRRAAPAHERHRNSELPCMAKRAAAIADRGIGVGKRQRAGARGIFLLHVDQHECRNPARVGQCAKRNDVAHARISRWVSTDGRETGRLLDASSTPGTCQRPSGRMTT